MPRKTDGIVFEIHSRPTKGEDGKPLLYVGESGDTYNRGIVVTCNDAAVLPAITIDLTKASWTVTTPVTSALP